ncbi:MAG: hypothetical protein GKR87_04835 [Kiritimatiellae bacterium]|nr:hypothetical protein [Kiritimatiellia bacterium]
MNDIRLLTIPLVVGGFILSGIVLTFQMGPVFGWGLLLAAMAGIMLIGRPKIVLFVYIFWVTVQQYIGNILPSSFIVLYLDELLVVVLLGILFFHHIQDRLHLPELKLIKLVLIGLISLVVFSAIANQVPKKLAFHFVLQYARFFLIFYYSYVFLSVKDLKAVYLSFSSLFLLQVLMNVGWLLSINPLPSWAENSRADFAIGIGLGANLIAYFSICFICVHIAVLLDTDQPRRRMFSFLMVLIGLFQLFVSYTFHAYILLFLCVGYQIFIASRSVQKQLFLVASVTLICALFVGLTLYVSSDRFVSNAFDLRNLSNRWASMWRGPKGQSYKNNLVYLPKDCSVFYLAGAGPGNGGSTVARINRRPLADRYFNWVDLSFKRRTLSEGGSITGGPMTGILSIWSDLGPLGFMVYWGLHLYTIYYITFKSRRGHYTDFYQRVFSQAFPSVMGMYIVLNILTDYIYLAFMSGGVWFLAACVWTTNFGKTFQKKRIGEENSSSLQHRKPVRSFE